MSDTTRKSNLIIRNGYVKPGIQEQGRGCGNRGECGGMLCPQTFRGMFLNILGNPTNHEKPLCEDLQ